MDYSNGDVYSIYYGLIAVFVVSFLITVTIIIFSYRSSIKDSFIYYFITNLLIVTMIHSSSYIFTFVDQTTTKNDFLCSLQSVVLIMSSQSQELLVVIITIICFQAILYQKIYNLNDNLLFFSFCFIMGNIILPGGIVIIFGLFDALGPYGYYCWIESNENDNNSSFILVIFIIKMIAITINTILSVIMLVIVCRKDNHIESNRQAYNLCIKTIIFPIIQMAFIISWFIFSQIGKKEITCYISSSTGIIYPLYIGWYLGIVGSNQNKEKSFKSFSEMAIDKGSVRNTLMRESKFVNDIQKMNSSFDYYE